jgi:hypothetical protein
MTLFNSRPRGSRHDVKIRSLLETLEPRRLLSSYYLSPAGSNTAGNGTELHPWATLAKINAITLHPGDVVLLQGGKTFTGNLVLGPNDSGTAASPVTVESYGTGVATISSPRGVGILAHDCGGITLMNLILVGPGRNVTTADGIQFLNDLPAGHIFSSINISNVTVSGFVNGIEMDAMPANGIGKNGYINVRITHSTLYNDAVDGIFTQGNYSETGTQYSFTNVYVGYVTAYGIYHNSDGVDTEDGIQLSDVYNGTVDHCVAHDNGLSGTGEVGIWAWDSNKVTIQYCTSYRNHTDGTIDGDGFALDGGDSNCIMQYNTSYDNDGAGYGIFQFDYARPYVNNIIRYNTTTNDSRKNGYGAIDIWNGNTQGIVNCQIYNNTIVVSPSAGAKPSGIMFEDLTDDVQVRDNSFTTTGGVPLVYIFSSQTDLVFKGNTFSSGGGTFRIIDQGKTYSSVKQWSAATGLEADAA